MLTKTARAKADATLPTDRTMYELQDAVRKAIVGPDVPYAMPAGVDRPWIRDFYADHAIVQQGDAIWSQGFAFGEDGTVTLAGAPVPVTEQHLYVPARKSSPVKAEEMSTSQLDRWLAGKISRRILVLPFGGPLKASLFGFDDDEFGRDVDGEYFDADTDRYGPPLLGLQDSRERLVDWHHVTFEPTGHTDPVGGAMKGAILGRIVLDEEPESVDVDGLVATGIWADFWANAGEKRRALVSQLEAGSVPLFGSSQPYPGTVSRGKAGHLDVWPIWRHTITTSPQNTFAVVPPLKAVLGPNTAMSMDAVRAFIAGLDSLEADLRRTFSPGGERASATFRVGGNVAAKAGRVISQRNFEQLMAGCDQLDEALRAVRDVAASMRGANAAGSSDQGD